jgi:hypothetical protein
MLEIMTTREVLFYPKAPTTQLPNIPTGTSLRVTHNAVPAVVLKSLRSSKPAKPMMML